MGRAVTRWTLTDAKNRLSEVLDRASDGEIQTITRRGREFVLLEADRYRRLSGERPSLVDYLVDDGPRIDEAFDPRVPDTASMADPFDGDGDRAA